MTNLNPMYRNVAGDRTTTLAQVYHANRDTVITVSDSSILPSAPNYVTIRMANETCLVTVLYTQVTGNQLSGLTVVESDIPIGLIATYPIGSYAYRTLTSADVTTIQDNIRKIAQESGIGHASKTEYGTVKIGTGIDVTDGVISVDIATTQADWEETDSGSPSYIRRKPNLIPLRDFYVSRDLWVESADLRDEGYNYRAKIEYPGVTANHMATVEFDTPELLSNNFSETCETTDGGVYIYAIRNPGHDICLTTVSAWKIY